MNTKQHYRSLLHQCAAPAALRRLHARLLTAGLLPALAADLLLRCCALKSLDHAQSVMLCTQSPVSSSAFNHAVRALAAASPTSALPLFAALRRKGHRPDHLALNQILKTCSLSSNLVFGAQTHAEALKIGVLPVDVYVANALANLYAVCSNLEHARKVFDEMPLRTVSSYNTLLTALSRASRHAEALSVLAAMAEAGLRPDEATFVVLLSVAASTGSLSLGRCLHARVVVDDELGTGVQLGTALVNMYAKCGAIAYARGVFDTMRVRNVWTWSAMILGYTHCGSVGRAVEIYRVMTGRGGDGVRPNYVTFLALLSACGHAGLVEEAYGFFDEMVRVYGIEPRMTHYSAMVDVLGRKGLLREAYGFVRGMPVEPDAVVWRTLLSACQMHGLKDVDGIGEDVKMKLLALEPRRSGNYVIAANMLSEEGSWDEAAKVRRIMRDEGLKKAPGESTVEVNGKIHRFISGDEWRVSCSAESINQVMHSLVLNMKHFFCDEITETELLLL